MESKRLNLFYLSQGLGFIYFWISLAIPYLMYRGLSAYQAFSLLSLYQFLGVFLEYPTGVLGDRFGYKKTLLLANTLNALSMLILVQKGGILVYVVGLIVLAVGTGFSSGNNIGMLKSVSNNLRKDTANLTAQADFVIFFSSMVGAWIGAISYELALYISAGAMFSANLPLYFLPSDKSHRSSNHTLSVIIRDGLSAIRFPRLAQLFLIIAIFGGFHYSTKSIIGSFVDLYGYNLKSVGLYVGLSALCSGVGSKIYSSYQGFSKLHALVLLALTVFFMAIAPSSGIIIAILAFHIGAGYLFSAIDGDLHELAADHIRSSLFSLKRLLMRLVSSGYLLLYGLFINQGLFGLIMVTLGIMMIITISITRKYSCSS